MRIYIRCGAWFAAWLECSPEFGLLPLFAIDSCNGETILDIPYARLILTPRQRLLAERQIRDDERRDETETRPLPEDSQGDAEDRP